MGSRLLLAGNGIALFITIAAFLQLLSWPIAGLLIITSLTVTSLLYINPQKTHLGPVSGATNAKPVQERPLQKQTFRTQPHPVDPRLQPKQAKPGQPAPKALLQAPEPLPLVPKALPPVQTKPKGKAGETPTMIKEGDYLSFDVDLDSGKEVVGEVSASGVVNAYILTGENLTSLDLGQEFWHEAGSEGVQKATLHFTAPEKGKWFLVVENVDTKDVSASVRIRVNQTS